MYIVEFSLFFYLFNWNSNVTCIQSSEFECRSKLKLICMTCILSCLFVTKIIQRRLTALLCSASRGFTDCVRLLLDRGADFDTQHNVRWICFGKKNHFHGYFASCEWLSFNQKFTSVTQFCRTYIDRVFCSQCGFTALILASNKGHTDCVIALVDAGAGLDSRTNVRWVSNIPGWFLCIVGILVLNNAYCSMFQILINSQLQLEIHLLVFLRI
jgi:hypothetical protein